MSGLQMEELSVVLDSSYAIWVDVLILFLVLCDRIVGPASFPKPINMSVLLQFSRIGGSLTYKVLAGTHPLVRIAHHARSGYPVQWL